MPPVKTTDVREWAKAQPDLASLVPERGPLPVAVRRAYDNAHESEGDPGAGGGSDDYDGGISAADFAQAAPPPGGGQAAASQGTAAGETPPRAVGKRKRGSLRERIWQPRSTTRAGGTKRPGGKRQPLTNFIEDLWGDLAWLAAPVPPVQRLLYVQAPYAGVVLDDAVKDTLIDAALQPVAKNMDAMRAVTGLGGSLVFTGFVTARGERVPYTVVDAVTGQPVLEPDGQGGQREVTRMDFTPQTKLALTGLRFCLLQMTKVTGKQVEDITAAATEREQRGHKVDELMSWILGFPPPPEVAENSAEDQAMARARDLLSRGDQDDK